MVYTIDEIKTRITPVAEKYGIPAVYLFGSYARGTATEESDVDLLVDTAGTCLTNLFALGGLYCDFEDALRKKIDLLTLGSLEQSVRMPSDILFRASIRKDMMNIYDIA